MAQRQWILEKGSEYVCRVNEGTVEKPQYQYFVRCEVRKLFPSFTKLNEGQRFAILYGIKQKLSDMLARGKDQPALTIGETKEIMVNGWKSWLDGSLFEKKTRTRAPSVPLHDAVRKMREAGLSDAVIAGIVGKNEEEVADIV